MHLQDAYGNTIMPDMAGMQSSLMVWYKDKPFNSFPHDTGVNTR